MVLSNESIIVILFVGLVAGWLAGKIVRGTGFGIIGDILVGIAGAFIAALLFPKLGIHIGTGMVSGDHLFRDRRHHPAADRAAGTDRRAMVTGVANAHPWVVRKRAVVPMETAFLHAAGRCCPNSEVRIIVRHPRLRTSESRDTSNILI